MHRSPLSHHDERFAYSRSLRWIRWTRTRRTRRLRSQIRKLGGQGRYRRRRSWCAAGEEKCQCADSARWRSGGRREEGDCCSRSWGARRCACRAGSRRCWIRTSPSPPPYLPPIADLPLSIQFHSDVFALLVDTSSPPNYSWLPLPNSASSSIVPEARGWFASSYWEGNKSVVHGGLNERNERLGDGFILEVREE